MLRFSILQKRCYTNESTRPNIWEDYKIYGISKYKLIVLKARESQSLDANSHFNIKTAEMIINENKWEEFLDVDLKYFDKGIREKFIEVGEKELYDLYYDYDSNFSHGLWGSIRESSMLICESVSHQYRPIPDIDAVQNLPSILPDLKKIICLLFEESESLINDHLPR